MGKALVINGLIVTNPLTTVTFDLPVTGITLDKSSVSINTGENVEVTAQVTTSDGSIVFPVFSVSDSTKATIVQNRNKVIVNAISNGSVILTAKAGEYTATCSITIKKTVAEILTNYYSINPNISSSEKAALETLIAGMLTNGLWDKVDFFYPMLGDTAEKMAIEVVDDSTSLPKYTYGKDGNLLIGHPESEGESQKILTGRKFKSTACIVGSGKTSSLVYGNLVDAYTIQNPVKQYIAQLTFPSGYLMPRFNVSDIGSTEIKEYTGDYNDRIFGYLVNPNMSGIKLYDKTTLFSDAQAGTLVEEYTLQRVFGVFQFESVKYSSCAIFNSLTEEEYIIYENLLETFLTSTGKR